jgi:hypothetical protein
MPVATFAGVLGSFGGFVCLGSSATNASSAAHFRRAAALARRALPFFLLRVAGARFAALVLAHVVAGSRLSFSGFVVEDAQGHCFIMFDSSWLLCEQRERALKVMEQRFVARQACRL